MKLITIAKMIVMLIIALFILRFVASAQSPSSQPDMNIDAAARTAVLESLIKQLNDLYVFPDVAKQMENDLRARVAAKEYDGITSSQKFAEKLTADLQSISHDKHLRVRYSSKPIPVRERRGEPSDAERAEFERSVKFENFGFERVERLRGNIGYIELMGFFAPELGAETVRSAIGLVANSDALIFDLRRNGGGDPEMVALICSYLFGDERVHLNDLYFRPEDKTEEFWTNPKVPGKKFLGKHVYVLTSNRTFSGAEEFANNLKVLKRATIVGETTGGGANPGGSVRLSEHFGAFVPTGRAINPITKTNWEGVGVEPDIKVAKEYALQTAQLAALNAMLKEAADDDRKALLNRLIKTVGEELDKLRSDTTASAK